MSLQPLDYESDDEIVDDVGRLAGRWALSLALVAVLLDALTFGTLSGRNGMNWAFALPCACLDGVIAPMLAVVAGYLAVRNLARLKGRDLLSWITLVLAVSAAAGAIAMFIRSAEAAASV